MQIPILIMVHGAFPFSGFKTSFYEGGIRVPFVLKVPKAAMSSIPSSSNIVKGYAFVNDIAPTIYQIANITYPKKKFSSSIHFDTYLWSLYVKIIKVTVTIPLVGGDV